MKRRLQRRLGVPGLLLIVVTALSSAMAQAPDSAAIEADIERARKIAGSEWADAVRFWCEPPLALASRTALVARLEGDPEITPARIFDDLYVMGRTSTIVFALSTSDGIVLFDSGSPNQVESVLVPQMKKLGLDPAAVKHIFLTDRHHYHFGGASYFQQRYGTHVYMTEVGWDAMLDASPARGRRGTGAFPHPTRDRVIMDGDPIVIGGKYVVPLFGDPFVMGGVRIIPVFTPGRTSGSSSFIFPVTDQGRAHMAGLFGGATILDTFAYSDGGQRQYDTSASDMQQFVRSVAYMKAEAGKHQVDVGLINHPMMDGFNEKLAKSGTRKPGEPNPFIVGETSYQSFLDVMSTCNQVMLHRREQ